MKYYFITYEARTKNRIYVGDFYLKAENGINIKENKEYVVNKLNGKVLEHEVFFINILEMSEIEYLINTKMVVQMDNRKTKIKDFYKMIEIDSCCSVCCCNAADYILMDGYDTRICESCSFDTLEDHNFSEDYESDRYFKKAIVE